ncbi:MAG: PHA/PHB synthase family protein [Deferrisomatales bacterium]
MTEPTKALPEKLAESSDPYGIFPAVQGVQKAWLEHPAQLGEELSRLSRDAWAVQLQALRRVLGANGADEVPANPRDERFQDPIWTTNPYLDAIKEQYLLGTRWLEDAIYNAPGADEADRRRAGFWARQLLNALSPTNSLLTNPGAQARAYETGGQSLVDGMRNFIADAARGTVSMVDETQFVVGGNLATTPGAVVHRNELMELIQYRPTTEQVHAVPIVIVAPWINKYYILDLTEQKSMVRYLVSQGFTVFIVSWKNPGTEMRDTTLDDYLVKGVGEAVEVAREVCGVPQVHLAGYCIGGTIVAAYMAWMNRQARKKADLPVAHWTVFATLVDFASPGEIDVFISDGAIRSLEQRMAKDGYLDGKDMATAFRLLRSNGLIWHCWVRYYLYGEAPPPIDVLFWNVDTTRMPEAMHAFYLRAFYLENRLAQKDGVTLGGRPIDLGRISQPLYAVGTEQDHIAPWKETFKLCSLVGGPTRYTLATSGHILGIVSPPVDPPKRRYWAGEAGGQADAEAWLGGQQKVPGSWWSDWTGWLSPQCGERRAPPTLGNASHPCLAEAPGTYVMEK